MQICIVEDDLRLAKVLQQTLEEDGSTAVHLASGRNATSYIASQHFDAVVLDLMLPGTSGLTVLNRLRQSRCGTPVLVLSALDTVPEMVRALDAGADDYLTKPFDIDLFLARVRSVSRRGIIPQGTSITVGPVTLETTQRRVWNQGSEIDLTRREYMMLGTLARRSGQVVTRRQLTDAVWGSGTDVSEGNLDYHVHSLRAKLGQVTGKMIRTVRGVGYVLQNVAEDS